MKYLFLSFFLLLILCNHINAQGFELTFGGPGTQVCNDIILSPDNCVYMLGYDDAGLIGGNDFMLSKVNSSGQLLWTRHIGSTQDDFGYSLFYRPGPKLVLVGTTYDSLMGSQALIIVTDTSGNQISQYDYGTSETENICAANSTPDGGYVLCGYQSVSGTNYTYVLKLDSAFNEQWSASYGAGVNDYANETIMTNDSSCYVAADRRFNMGGGNFDYDVCMLYFDGIGQIQWDSVYTLPFQNGGQGLIESKSGNIIYFGETEIYQFSPFDYLIAAVNPQGEQLWRYTFGGPGTNALFDLVEDSAGYFIGTGYGNSASSGNDPLNLTLVKVDSTGNVLWEREYGFQGIDMGYSILLIPGGGFLAGGRATTQDGDDFFLVKTDQNGITSLPEYPAGNNKVVAYPNPFKDFVMFSSEEPVKLITIYDGIGKIIYQTDPGEINHSIRAELQFLNPGYYFSEIRFAGNYFSRIPLVKIR